MIRFAWRGLRLAVVVAALAAAPAFAQDTSSSEAQSTVPDELLGLVGDFMLEQEDESLPGCPITLSDRAAPGGWAIEVPETCPAPYPTADKLSAWNLDETDGSIIFLDPAGTVVMRLFEDEDGLYDTAPETEPRFYLMAPYDEDGTGGEADGDLEGTD
jgi:hypothetical protein